ncbi:MAG: Inorganic pyrophosphatase, partial [Paramarteilia canceri]
KEDGTKLSYLHSVCLQPSKSRPDVFNMIVEIPRFTHKKMEISLKIDKNPIVQDIKKGKPRFLPNVFPCYGYPANYGALPQVYFTIYCTKI